MKRITSIYVLFLVILLCGVVRTESCKKVDSCRCTFSDSHIDLTPLVNNFNSPPRFKDKYDQYYSRQYSYNPCFSFNESSCINVAVCMINYGTYTNIGTQETVNYNTSLHNVVSISYRSYDGRTSIVRLVCSTGESNLEVIGEGPSFVYNFVLTSPYCCFVPGSLLTDSVSMSVGIILIAGFSIFLMLTMIVGLILYKFGPRVQIREINFRQIHHNAYVPINRISTPPPYSTD